MRNVFNVQTRFISEQNKAVQFRREECNALIMLAFPCCPDLEDINNTEASLPFVFRTGRSALALTRRDEPRDEPAGFSFPAEQWKSQEKVLLLNVLHEDEVSPSLIG